MHTGYVQYTQYLKFSTVPAWRRTEQAAAGSAPHLRSNTRSGYKLSATEVVYSSEIDGISRQTLTTDRAVYRSQSASGMYGVGMTSTSAPSLKENGDLLLEKYAHAISVALTTSTVFQTEQQRSQSATTQQLTLLYIRELKLSALRSIYRPASHLAGHNLT